MANKQDKAPARRTGNPAGAAAGAGQQKQSARQASKLEERKPASTPEERKQGAGGANSDFLQENLF
ncbi:hypothetical protein DXT99_26550 [Pontibacter diazotrophicus]|uniref:Uncharacterized protein n=1 Tax=Pontibacter diazotrophicus TaxID=1400979 RepID=A0A3D8KZ08_9BACT|nr:hypothetical protein [Pontibacter diazotrophicus]RDV10356.1 hypothetical protein DXT99_26550 [Pontibacter diazotrophicus]